MVKKKALDINDESEMVELKRIIREGEPGSARINKVRISEGGGEHENID